MDEIIIQILLILFIYFFIIQNIFVQNILQTENAIFVLILYNKKHYLIPIFPINIEKLSIYDNLNDIINFILIIKACACSMSGLSLADIRIPLKERKKIYTFVIEVKTLNIHIFYLETDN